MKPYFAKYLPVEGDIKNKDFYYANTTRGQVLFQCDGGKGLTEYEKEEFVTGSPVDHENYRDSRDKKHCKKVKLFLCSRDIQVGDNFTLDREEVKCDEIYESLPARYGFVCKDNSTGITGDSDDPFKIIGEISPEAIWVKEGDEFDESEIEYQTHIYEDSPDKDKETFFNPKFKYHLHTIGLKGPCGHFH